MENCIDKKENNLYRVSIGVPVYNEERNIGKLIESILSQNEFNFLEAIFVLSGCNDRSEAVVKKYMQKDNRLKLVIQKKREGKASAINLFLKKAEGNIAIISSSDVILDRNCLHNLLLPFRESRIGMTGVHPLPVRNSKNFIYLLNRIIWQLHHELCLKIPKLGEAIAFRNVIDELPVDCAVDEVYIEAFIKSKGYDLCYKEDAFVYSRCPMRFKDLFIQRMRIYWGHIDVKSKYGYKVASLNMSLILRIVIQYLIKRPYMILPFMVLGLLESLARGIAVYKYFFLKEPVPFIWPEYNK